MILDEYKNNIKKNKNFKVGLYTETDLNKEENTYMSLEFDSELYNGAIIHANIPKINLNSINMINSNFNYHYSLDVEFNTHSVKDSFITMTDVTPYKEMTVKDIEKELGYKIKIKE